MTERRRNDGRLTNRCALDFDSAADATFEDAYPR